MLSSQGLVFATAMAVSAGTFILLDLLTEKYLHSHQNQTPEIPDSPPPADKRILKSCLASSGGKKKGENKKKRVHFAEDVKGSDGNGKEYRKEHRRRSSASRDGKIQFPRRNSCGKEILEDVKRLPPNHLARYNGILKNRVLGMEYSH